MDAGFGYAASTLMLSGRVMSLLGITKCLANGSLFFVGDDKLPARDRFLFFGIGTVWHILLLNQGYTLANRLDQKV